MRTLNQILAIAVKDLRHLLRDKTAAFFVLVFPLFIALLFGSIFGGGGGGDDALKVGVFNEDTGANSAKFVQTLDDDSSIAVQSVATMEEGEAGVRKGNIIACLHLRPGFDPQQIFGNGITIEGVVDPKRTAETGLLEGKLNQIAFMQMSSMFNDPGASRTMMDNARHSLEGAEMAPEVKAALTTMFASVDSVSDEVDKTNKKEEAQTGKKGGGASWTPVHVELQKLTIDQKSPPSAFAMSFPQGVVWGLMGLVTGFASGFATERTKGTLMRLNVSPASPATILAGKALACFLACLMVQALMLGMASIPYFKVTFSNPLLLAVACVAAAFALTGIAMLIAGLSKSEEAAGGLARGALIVLAMIGGGSIPLIFMPPFMRTISVISPFKWTSEAIEGALWRGFSLSELALPLLVLVGIGVVGFGVGTLGLMRQRKA